MNFARFLVEAVLLPPLSLLWLGLLAGLLAWRGRRWAGLVAALAGLACLALATPLASGLLLASLEREARDAGPTPPGLGAIIILAGDVAHGRATEPASLTIGRLTLERLRDGAALHRATGLPILVTGGPIGPGQTPLGELMARSLRDDFQLPVRWVEVQARDTADNAARAKAMLHADGVGAAYLVTQAWHMPRARDAFTRLGFVVAAAPVRRNPLPMLDVTSLMPRGTHLADSWFVAHEWVGRLFYALRDGRAQSAAVALAISAMPAQADGEPTETGKALLPPQPGCDARCLNRPPGCQEAAACTDRVFEVSSSKPWREAAR